MKKISQTWCEKLQLSIIIIRQILESSPRAIKKRFERDGDTISNQSVWNVRQSLENKRLEELKIKERIETILTTDLLRSARMFWGAQET